MASNQFYLKWNNHQESLVSTFNLLLSEESMVDVTLCCEGQRLKAHKMILSASSPLFQNLFKENPSKHPVIILQETKYYNMKSIIDFIYKGQICVSQDQLSGILKTAEALKIRGLVNIPDDDETSTLNMTNNSINASEKLSTKSYKRKKRKRKKSFSDSDSEEELPRNIKESETPNIVIKNATSLANKFSRSRIDFAQDATKIESEIKETKDNSDLDCTIIEEVEVKKEEEKAKSVSPPVTIPTNKDRSVKVKDSYTTPDDMAKNENPNQSYTEAKYLPAEYMEVASGERQNKTTDLLQTSSNHVSLSKDVVRKPQETLSIAPQSTDISPETDRQMEEENRTETRNDIQLALSPSCSSIVDDASDGLRTLSNSEKLSDTEPFSASCDDENSIFDKADTSLSEPSTSQMEKDSINSTNPEPDKSPVSMKYINDTSEFNCDVCQNKFSYKHELRRHIRIHTGERSYECDQCKHSFKKKSNLESHLRTHTKEKPFQCDDCNLRFSQKGSLISHLRIHTGEKPFQCYICQRSFSQKAALSNHLRTHSGEKPFICDICKQSFGHQQTLKNHYRIHTGEKPFQCDICKRRFTQRGHLISHIRIHTG